ncbi:MULTISPECIES: galactokinase [unclassified Clostridium]|uniref:galactokinase n=1 Tax=unclassified Clostridium TaxID=2614128 RepID=UPI002A827B42|nr:galactokinase family protein [Clostridium sp.]MCI6693163.1 galactokinase [Clostridium sp.]MDY4252755.1 galactokinase family protein [Clostridium sp.]
MKLPKKEKLLEVYGEDVKVKERYKYLSEKFQENFNEDNFDFFSAPGRTEIIGNHTDHNGGKVIAASISMDTIGAAALNNSNLIKVISEGYEEIVVDITRLDSIKKGNGTVSLIAGIVEGTINQGFKISGFNCYITTEVISAAGVSSSASFEMLLCSIINYFFNENTMSIVDYAKIGQYAENVYWKKDSGLMDQMACAAGGAIYLDFSNEVKYKKIDFNLQRHGYKLVIVNTEGDHADLSNLYSSIPKEMYSVSNAMGCNKLSERTFKEFLDNLGKLNSTVENDRAILRALHFYEENIRVENVLNYMDDDNLINMFNMIEESGNSSWKLLQNCYYENKKQNIIKALALSELFIKLKGRGCCRVHGGGFAGVIMCILNEEDVNDYIEFISKIIKKDNIYDLNIRKVGAIHLEK